MELNSIGDIILTVRILLTIDIKLCALVKCLYVGFCSMSKL